MKRIISGLIVVAFMLSSTVCFAGGWAKKNVRGNAPRDIYRNFLEHQGDKKVIRQGEARGITRGKGGGHIQNTMDMIKAHHAK